MKGLKNIWKRRKAAKELEIEARKYGLRGSLFDHMRELYKDEWDGFIESIVDGDKPSVVAEGIVYEFIIWTIKKAIGRDETAKTRMREAIENSELKDRLPIFRTIDFYLFAQMNDRVSLSPNKSAIETEEGRKVCNQTVDGLSAWVAKEIFDGSETNRIMIRDYINLSSKKWGLVCIEALLKWTKSDKGEFARLERDTVLSGEIDIEEVEELFKPTK